MAGKSRSAVVRGGKSSNMFFRTGMRAKVGSISRPASKISRSALMTVWTGCSPSCGMRLAVARNVPSDSSLVESISFVLPESRRWRGDTKVEVGGGVE